MRQRLRELAQERPRFGSPRLHVLLRREGLVQNHKRTEWLYRAEGLSLRLKRRKKRPSHLRVVMPTPNGADESWAMDFVADALVHGRRIPAAIVQWNAGRIQPVVATPEFSGSHRDGDWGGLKNHRSTGGCC
ncbi:IS3 family transposase [Burkholderia stabilis]|uniref:IS3 family transposase n=1 Tax=Burkholderia stabilis TaxID=95485 RepID=UPI001F0BC319|nr:IS3 family transposase [Burkholderia stabilis]